MQKFLLILLLLGMAGLVQAQVISGKHKENKLTCAQCHGTTGMPTKAAPQRYCIGCHGEMWDGKKVLFEEKGHKYQINPHDSHESPINCTKCHATHKPSSLYCNECHAFDVKVP